jgi:ElaB/YqjD/DUF883 family membrane-anchored ribosome-binding protein
MKTSNNPSTNSNSNGSNLQASTATSHDTADRGRDIANHTFDQLASAVESARSTAVPAIEKLTTKAESMAQRSVELARTGTQQVRDQALLVSEMTAGYVRQAPVKSLLFAVGIGALLAIIFSPGRRERT